MKIPTSRNALASSFRDPSGSLFTENGILYRQINQPGFEDYFSLIDSGLYQSLVDENLIIPHEEISDYDHNSPPNEIIIKPESIAFISYPYEWSFSQLKNAALSTLKIQKIALSKGMSLKDCSAYNIQFHHGKPTLIDTLSFERYQEGEPWAAYRQFCQHFFAPLALMAYTDIRLNQLQRVYIDGVPLDLASKLLPRKTSLNFSLNIHIHLHAKSQERYSSKEINRAGQMSKPIQEHQLLGLLESLESGVKKLNWKDGNTSWADYEEFHNYSAGGMNDKVNLVSDYITRTQASMVWDLGANIGKFSRLASQQKMYTIAFDFDPGAVELNYQQTIQESDPLLLPLIVDLTNPSPDLGWAHEERQSLMQRGPVDTVLALALIHHLAIGNNVPLPKLANFFHRICKCLIIEFVPKSDPQVARLLHVRRDIFSEYNQDHFVNELRRDIFSEYNQDHFVNEFGKYFEIISQGEISDSQRVIFLMRNRSNPQELS
jgi:ribosomal protein L11 methylase PrmA